MADDDIQYATADDLSAILTLIEAHSRAGNEGFPAFVEPEPETVKGRFGRTKEVPVEHSVGIHLADPATGSMEAMFTAPENPAERFENGTLPLAPGWAIDETMPGSGRLYSEGPPAADLTARWLVDTLLALGAPLPTGRWRCYSPQMPGWWYHS